MTESKGRVPAGIDVRRPSVARAYDYILGGKDNYAADREFVDAVIALLPDTPLAARENRAFLGRVVHFLAEAGIRQFLDIGSGLPTRGNVHEVAHAVAPDARVVYVDYDPVAIAHTRQLLSSVDNTIAIQADVRQPDDILDNPRIRKLIDFDQPVAVLLISLLHLVPDDDDPAAILARFRAAMASGSYLALSHMTGDYQAPDSLARLFEITSRMVEPLVPRTQDQIGRFFDGMEFVDPGLVKVSEWRPDELGGIQTPGIGWYLAGVARKP